VIILEKSVWHLILCFIGELNISRLIIILLERVARGLLQIDFVASGGQVAD
jgi:hypothetical protein